MLTLGAKLIAWREVTKTGSTCPLGQVPNSEFHTEIPKIVFFGEAAVYNLGNRLEAESYGSRHA
jgi:hypothetical protein